jgi:mannose-6-phosphate isomerase-like protein (cupin superfamily)
MKKGYKDNIEKLTIENTAFRKVLYTAEGMQLVLMSIGVGEDIGDEVHNENDQFFRIEQGKGKAIIDDTEYDIADDDVVIVPRGSNHNIINTSDNEELKLYTIYTPPHHKDQVLRETKQEALDDEPHFDGNTTE